MPFSNFPPFFVHSDDNKEQMSTIKLSKYHHDDLNQTTDWKDEMIHHPVGLVIGPRYQLTYRVQNFIPLGIFDWLPEDTTSMSIIYDAYNEHAHRNCPLVAFNDSRTLMMLMLSDIHYHDTLCIVDISNGLPMVVLFCNFYLSMTAKFLHDGDFIFVTQSGIFRHGDSFLVLKRIVHDKNNNNLSSWYGRVLFPKSESNVETSWSFIPRPYTLRLLICRKKYCNQTCKAMRSWVVVSDGPIGDFCTSDQCGKFESEEIGIMKSVTNLSVSNISYNKNTMGLLQMALVDELKFREEQIKWSTSFCYACRLLQDLKKINKSGPIDCRQHDIKLEHRPFTTHPGTKSDARVNLIQFTNSILLNF